MNFMLENSFVISLSESSSNVCYCTCLFLLFYHYSLIMIIERSSHKNKLKKNFPIFQKMFLEKKFVMRIKMPSKNYPNLQELEIDEKNFWEKTRKT